MSTKGLTRPWPQPPAPIRVVEIATVLILAAVIYETFLLKRIVDVLENKARDRNNINTQPSGYKASGGLTEQGRGIL